jgi:hypothetical protein
MHDIHQPGDNEDCAGAAAVGGFGVMGWDDALKVVGALGGVGVVSAGVSAWIGGIVSSRVIQKQKAKLDEQLETHKDMLLREADRNRLLLKRQELMFERELAAAIEFLKVQANVVPDTWAPDLDWYDAQERIAENLISHDQALKKLLDQHSVSLSAEARKLIGSAKSAANSGSFGVAQETTEGEYEPGSGPSDAVRKIVDEFYETMQAAEIQIRQDLRAGSLGV